MDDTEAEVFAGWTCGRCRETTKNAFGIKLEIAPFNKEEKLCGFKIFMCDRCALAIASMAYPTNFPGSGSFLTDIARMVVEERYV